MSEELTTKVQDLIDNMINPAVAGHGGFVQLVDVKDNKVYLQMGGGCQGCGAADVTLKQGIERLIKEEIPEVGDYVEYTIGDESVLMVRNGPDSIVALPNACLHRGTRLASGAGHVADGSFRIRPHMATTMRRASGCFAHCQGTARWADGIWRSTAVREASAVRLGPDWLMLLGRRLVMPGLARIVRYPIR